MPDPDPSDKQDSLADEILTVIESPIIILDPDAVITRFNRAAEKLTGYSAQEAIGQRLWDFLIEQDDSKTIEDIFVRTATDSEPVYHTHNWLTKGGQRRLMKCVHHSTRSRDGKIAYILAIATDITEITSTRQELSESRSFLRSIIDASPVAVITINTRGEILSFSKAAEIVFGYKEREMLGNNITMLMPEPDHSRHGSYLSRYLETGNAHIIGRARTINALRRNGDVFPAVLHVSEFRDGEKIFVGFIEDVSEQKATEQHLAETQLELQHAARLGAMGQIATAIAHELNQPLTAAASLAGAAQLTLKKGKTPPPDNVTGMLEDAVQEIRRASHIIYQMREFVRKGKTLKSSQNVNDVIEEACVLALIGADAGGIEVIRRYDEHAGQAFFDRTQIQQVIINLVRNAIDAMHQSPVRKLTISTIRHTDTIEVRVEDTGPGLDPDIEEQLFNPFVSNKEKGMGIGLSLSKTIIDAHQGQIFTIDKNSNGCIFAFTLPASERNEPGKNQ